MKETDAILNNLKIKPSERPDWTLFRKAQGNLKWEIIPGAS